LFCGAWLDGQGGLLAGEEARGVDELRVVLARSAAEAIQHSVLEQHGRRR
jgi:hypothetical protein